MELSGISSGQTNKENEKRKFNIGSKKFFKKGGQNEKSKMDSM